MKKLLIAVIATVFVSVAFAESEIKEVCHDKLDKKGNVVTKNGNAVQDCKKIKVHKKLKGTEIPGAKK